MNESQSMDFENENEVILDTVILLEKKEIVAGLEAAFRKSGRGSNIVKTIILSLACILFMGSSIYEKKLIGFNSLLAAVTLVIIFLLWFLPAFKFGKIAEDMIAGGKNKLYLKIKGDLFIFGEENTVCINFREQTPVFYLENMVFNQNGNIFVVPSRILGDKLWNRYTSF